MILVGKFGWDRDSSHGPSRRHPGLRLYTSREPQGRAPYYNAAAAARKAIRAEVSAGVSSGLLIKKSGSREPRPEAQILRGSMLVGRRG